MNTCPTTLPPSPNKDERPWLTFVPYYTEVFAWELPAMEASQISLNLGCAFGSIRTLRHTESTRKALGISKAWMKRFRTLANSAWALDWSADPSKKEAFALIEQFYVNYRALLLELEQALGHRYRIRFKRRFYLRLCGVNPLWEHLCDGTFIEYFFDEHTLRSYRLDDLFAWTQTDTTGKAYFILAQYHDNLVNLHDSHIAFSLSEYPPYWNALVQACRLGYVPAAEEMLYYAPDYNDEPKAFAAFIKPLQHLAEHSPRLQLYVGLYYLHVRKWPRVALRWFNRVVEAHYDDDSFGAFEAHLEVAKVALFGKAAERNYEKAFTILNTLAEGGRQNHRLFLYLAYIYEKGLFVAPDKEKAIKLYRLGLRRNVDEEAFQRLKALSPSVAKAVRSSWSD